LKTVAIHHQVAILFVAVLLLMEEIGQLAQDAQAAQALAWRYDTRP
jgi:hypothetical protein